MFEKFKTKFHAGRAALVTAVLAAPVLAFADGTDPFDAVVTNVSGKVNTYGAGLVTVAAIGVVFMIGIKYIKKIRGAA